MAKSVLVDFQGNVQHICNPGEEFEIYEGPNASVRWVSCPSDEINDSWVLVQGTWESDVQSPPSYSVLRQHAYGDIGEQLDMLYKDMKNGTTEWMEHIEAVKETVPGPNSEEARAVQAARPPIKWGQEESPSWTDNVNRAVPGLLLTIGKKFSD